MVVSTKGHDILPAPSLMTFTEKEIENDQPSSGRQLHHFQGDGSSKSGMPNSDPQGLFT
jgi:hypothetical protein